ncbi:MAG: hypothetical protein U0R64_07135 [Candidatus Nanopelagicales bacterium]
MAKRIVGAVLLILGILLAAGGGLCIAAFGPSGNLTVRSTPLQTAPDGYALVADVVAVNAGFPGSSLLGTPTLGADSTGPDRLFVGIGSRTQVNEYLNGVAFEAVRQDGSQWQSFSVPGGKKPAPPADQDLWIRRATGNAPTVDFSGSSTGTTFVVMNDDAGPDVKAQIVIGYTSRWIFPLSVAAIVIGIFLVVWGGVWLFRRRTASDETMVGDSA